MPRSKKSRRPRPPPGYRSTRRINWFQLLEDIAEWGRNVEAGADPIEAAHGHLCGPGCLHWEDMSRKEQTRLMKAPWNRERVA